MARHIERLEQLLADYDAILCDVWGVVHNGVAPFPLAVEALTAAREAGNTVVLVTNSPRPAEGVVRQFGVIGVSENAFDDIVTSGDVTRRLVIEGPKKLYFVGPERDRSLVEGLDVELVDEAEAEAVLCTGPFDDENETPEDYAEMLARLKARELPFYCANPDQVVERGDRLIYCAGAIGTAYEKLGGETRVAGKPYPPIYAEAMRRIEALRGATAKSRVLAIGDGMGTDIRGAIDAGFDVLFVARGIHAAEYYENRKVDAARLEAFFAREATEPSYWTDWVS